MIVIGNVNADAKYQMDSDAKILGGCSNVQSVVDDAVLSCAYPAVGNIAGIDLPVRVCVKDPSTPASDWCSNTDVVLSYDGAKLKIPGFCEQGRCVDNARAVHDLRRSSEAVDVQQQCGGQQHADHH